MDLAEGTKRDSGVTFHKIGIAAQDNDHGFNGWKMRTLSKLIENELVVVVARKFTLLKKKKFVFNFVIAIKLLPVAWSLVDAKQLLYDGVRATQWTNIK